MSQKKFYITAAIPYVNGVPHIGHALEFVQCDAVARYKKLTGRETLLLSGSDENGLKIVQAAEQEGLTPQELADKNTLVFKNLVNKLNVGINVWQRASNKKLHWPGTHKLWQLCEKNGDIYKKLYGCFYCVGCEDFYTKKDLVDGKCPEHLKEPEWVEEENYFFRLSKYQERIEKLIETDELRVLPQTRKNEVLSFIRSGLEDFSISRSRQRAKNWGIPVPRDESQIIYAWFDGLNIYQTGVGFGYDENLWQKWWPADVHVIGKGIIRFHAVYWIGMLLSAGLSLPKSIFVHGYIASGGQKMSKSLGNVIDPFEVIQKYGAEALRYYLLREIPAYGDGDFTYERFEQLYNADLANGLGNMVARVAALAERAGEFSVASLQFTDKEIEDVRKYLDEFRFDEAMKLIWSWIADLDRQINDKKPWTLSGPGLFETLTPWVKQINKLGVALQPFMPETAEKILTQFKGPKILSQAPLFPRF